MLFTEYNSTVNCIHLLPHTLNVRYEKKYCHSHDSNALEQSVSGLASLTAVSVTIIFVGVLTTLLL